MKRKERFKFCPSQRDLVTIRYKRSERGRGLLLAMISCLGDWLEPIMEET